MRFLDLRAAIRSLTRSPGFLTAAVLSLSVAIGASAAAFSVVDAVRFRTLPFPDGERLVRWWPGQDALGRTIRVDTPAGAAPVAVTIVGVVGDNRAAEPKPAAGRGRGGALSSL